MRVIITGGGTGGHIYPALAVARGIKERLPDAAILYVGTREGMEAGIVPENGFDFRGISGKGLPRKLSWETVRTGGQNLLAFWETKRILKDFHPDLVIGTGGYVSGPVVFTSALFGIPTLLHEQNALPGITNRILSRVVRKVMLTFPESAEYFKTKDKLVVVGLPVRKEIGRVDRKTGAGNFGLKPEKKTLLVTGGSRGAWSINKAMLHVLQELDKHEEIQLIWATGTATYGEIIKKLQADNIPWKKEQWKIVKYIHNMQDALACADLCICRAGATTLAEVSAAGKASILIPYPYAAENHQEYNARAFEDKGAAKVILDKDLSGELLWSEIKNILYNRFKLQEMSARAHEVFKPDALARIVDLCFQTAWK